MYEAFADRADFVHVYIAEAHASDVWPVEYPVCTPQHRSKADREAAAARFAATYNWQVPMVLDDMANTMAHTLGAWPFRLYIVHNNTIVFQGMPEDCTYPVAYLHSKLESLLEAGGAEGEAVMP